MVDRELTVPCKINPRKIKSKFSLIILCNYIKILQQKIIQVRNKARLSKQKNCATFCVCVNSQNKGILYTTGLLCTLIFCEFPLYWFCISVGTHQTLAL